MNELFLKRYHLLYYNATDYFCRRILTVFYINAFTSLDFFVCSYIESQVDKGVQFESDQLGGDDIVSCRCAVHVSGSRPVMF